MREILFRGKRIDNGNWILGFLIGRYDPKQEENIIQRAYIDGGTCFFTPDAVILETVGQYTGLTDKNGTKIFEGDIVKYRHNWHLQVFPRDGVDEEKAFFEQKIRNAYGKYKEEISAFWGNKYCYFRNYAVEYYAPKGCFRIRNGGQFYPLTGSRVFNGSLEIIGNIHDNPELLKAR